ncbi:MAG: hypothetical protein FWH47_06905, partial [Methanomassiliicoccaceae archaeon]|nr:hypothetical protein [Methanomassiliicoccaceae archaeon]
AQGVGAAQHRLSQMYKGGRAERPRRKEAGGSVVGKLRRGMLHELLDTAREALRGEDYPKARFILCVILNPWNSRPSLSQSPVTQAAWVMYADACLGLCYYDEAERVYGICADLCIQRGHAQERLEATATRRAGQRTPRVICDHEELRSILESVLPCFPWIEKDIMAFVVRGQRDLDDCLANRAGIKDRILLDKSELAFCTYGNPEAFVIVFKEEMLKKKMFKRQYTASGRVGVCAHELSHCSLSSGMAITDVCGRLDATTYRDVCRTLSDRMYSPSGGYCVSCNEYLTDAAAISRGFAFELLGVMDPDRNGAYMGYETVLSWWSV